MAHVCYIVSSYSLLSLIRRSCHPKSHFLHMSNIITYTLSMLKPTMHVKLMLWKMCPESVFREAHIKHPFFVQLIERLNLNIRRKKIVNYHKSFVELHEQLIFNRKKMFSTRIATSFIWDGTNDIAWKNIALRKVLGWERVTEAYKKPIKNISSMFKFIIISLIEWDWLAIRK